MVLLSGHVCAGKTTLAKTFASREPRAVIISSREILQGLKPTAVSRADLQALGAHLDATTRGAWLLPAALSVTAGSVVIVDAIRTSEQADVLGETAEVALHVHLVAPHAVLAERYAHRAGAGSLAELPSYEDVIADPTERSVSNLISRADLVLNSASLPVDACADVVARCLGAVARSR